MEIIKVLGVMAVGLGSVGIAHLATGSEPGGAPSDPPVAETTSAPPPSSPPVSTPPSAPAPADPPRVGDMSREEMEAELRKAQDELAGKPVEPGQKEFRASRPLPADLPIDLPSDI